MRLFISLFLNLVIVGLLLVFGYVGFMFYQAYTSNQNEITELLKPESFSSLLQFNFEEKWVPYESMTFTFEHPERWKPKKRDLTSNGVEAIDLQIPIVFSLPRLGSNNVIGYRAEAIDKARPVDLKREEEFVMADTKGYKWLYKKNEWWIYEYAIPLSNSSITGRQDYSFYLSVESVKEDKRLEALMDKVASTVQFKKVEGF